MCANSEAKLRGHCVTLYLGFYGGEITIGTGDSQMHYTESESEFRKPSTHDAAQFVAELSQYKASELAQLIYDLIHNSGEG